ncbi:MAG: hypothetical protein ACI9R3_005758, partial [Verrucomicrobiales bacterium]
MNESGGHRKADVIEIITCTFNSMRMVSRHEQPR